MNLAEWAPIPPWEGPPLPRWTGARWPWLHETTASLSLPAFFKGSAEPAPPSSTYDNAEEIEFPEGFDPVTFMPKRIVVHRKARVTRDQ